MEWYSWRIMRILFQNTVFLKSAAKINQLPEDNGIEIAFAGRSNAGKSSALNVLTNQKIAKTSKTPGRTRLLNFFTVTDTIRLVDLPGYGYAKVSLAEKKSWQQLLSEYLENRKCLRGLVLLMDIRHAFTDYDQQLLEWAQHFNLAVHILLTKADKLSKGKARSMLLAYQKEIVDLPNVSIQLFSSLKKEGIAELNQQITRWCI
jgi:GTP-binding protein